MGNLSEASRAPPQQQQQQQQEEPPLQFAHLYRDALQRHTQLPLHLIGLVCDYLVMNVQVGGLYVAPHRFLGYWSEIEILEELQDGRLVFVYSHLDRTIQGRYIVDRQSGLLRYKEEIKGHPYAVIDGISSSVVRAALNQRVNQDSLAEAFHSHTSPLSQAVFARKYAGFYYCIAEEDLVLMEHYRKETFHYIRCLKTQEKR